MELESDRKTAEAIVAIVLITGAAFFLYSGGFFASIAPGFEGETNGIWGYQPSGQTATVIGGALQAPSGSCAYSWNGPPTIASASVQALSPAGLLGCTGTTSDRIDFTAQTNVISYSNPLSAPISVNYYVNLNGGGTPTQVNGQVEIYTYNINVEIEPSSSGAWSFSGDTLWLNLASLVWNQASTSPTFPDAQGSVYEFPLYGVVTNVVWTNQADSACSLCTVGTPLVFYTFAAGQTPTTSGQTLATLTDGQPSASLNSTLAGNPAPDSRMSQLVYYPLTIEHFQNDCTLAGCLPPQAHITIMLYTLRIGSYILTNPDLQALQKSTTEGCTGFQCTLDSLGGVLSNPFAWLGGLFALGSGAVIVILLIVLGPTGLLLLLSRRKKGDEGND